MPILWVDLLITGTFTLGVTLLTVVQIKNFFTGLTTAERAQTGKKSGATRTSSYLS